MPAVKTGIANVAGAFCPHMGTIISGSNDNHTAHTASQQHMKNQQVAEMLTVYTQIQMVIC